MNSMIAFGTYVQGISCIHQLNAQVKIILTCVFSISIFFVSSWLGLAIASFLIAVGYLLSGIRLTKALAGLTPVAFILVFTVIAHMLASDPEAAPVLPLWMGTIELSSNAEIFGMDLVQGLASGLFFAGRIVLLVAACSLLTFTTSPLQVTEGLNTLLSPLERMKVPVDDLCLVVSVALRFVPIIAEEAYGLKRSYEARGTSFSGFISAAKAWGRILIPVIVNLFKRADRLAMAMDARAYGLGNRTSLNSGACPKSQLTTCLMTCVALVLLACFL